MQTLTRTLILLAGLACAVPAAAQTTPAAPQSNTGDLRHHIYVMEGALARAVDRFDVRRVARDLGIPIVPASE